MTSGDSWPTLIRVCVSQDENQTTNFKALQKYIHEINSVTNTNTTALHFVALGDNTDLAKWLIDNGAQIYENDEGQTPLHWACKSGSAGMVKLLMSVMTTDQIARKDFENTTALGWAIDYGRKDIASLLKKYKKCK